MRRWARATTFNGHTSFGGADDVRSVFGSAFCDRLIDGGSNRSAGGRIGVKVEF